MESNSHPEGTEESLSLRRNTAAAAECAREPIHIPGAIQFHGALLVLEEPSLKITQISANAPEMLGCKNLLGCALPDLIANTREYDALQSALDECDPALAAPLRLTFDGRAFDAIPHRQPDALTLELEPLDSADSPPLRYRMLQQFIERLESAADLKSLYAAIAEGVSKMTGFERILVYQFDADWNGETVGEVLTAAVDSYVGLHFPASDIPAQARALYARTWLRIIPNVDYKPAPLEPELNPRTGKPLDLSNVGLRSVSPVHLEYLRNMNVGASMSISLRVDGQLWGLIACHHRTPRLVPYATRAACEVFGQIASREIATKQETLALAERAETKTVQTQFFDLIASEKSVADALLRYMPALLEFMGASGAAIYLGNQVHLTGQTPDRTTVADLVKWLQEEEKADPIFKTDRLGELLPQAREYQDRGSGLLAVKLSRVQAHYVVWFRPEVVTTVSWAGKPEKTAEEASMRLHPRKSFAAWKETVKGRSLPWRDAEIEGAAELRLALNALVIRRTEQLLQLNTELERKNTDLNSFAYIASHDLKEPLRGIHHFTQFLLEDHAEALGAEGMRKAEMIRTLAGHTNELLDALSHFSKVGRMELHLREVDLDSLLGEVLLSLKVSLDEQKVAIRRTRPLPKMRCDLVLVREVFANLIANAARYNDKEKRFVEITWREAIPEKGEHGPVLIVRDNGIGIRERNHELVFQMFWRLNKNTTGSGAGLAIVKSIIERHGGRIWLDSELGAGSTFLFTLE